MTGHVTTTTYNSLFSIPSNDRCDINLQPSRFATIHYIAYWQDCNFKFSYILIIIPQLLTHSTTPICLFFDPWFTNGNFLRLPYSLLTEGLKLSFCSLTPYNSFSLIFLVYVHQGSNSTILFHTIWHPHFHLPTLILNTYTKAYLLHISCHLAVIIIQYSWRALWPNPWLTN